MTVFRLEIAYDGTEFHGWQIQPGQRTVQGTLEVALKDVLGVAPAALSGAGRTDAGVHARGQVVSFAAATRLPARALPPELNRRLPGDVRVRAAREAEEGFHARFSATARRYAYWLLDREDVLWERFAWHPRAETQGDALDRATQPLEGTHDCSAFRAAGGAPSRPLCRVIRAGWSRWERGWRLDIVADHFLYHMVRNIVGTVLAAAATQDPAAHMRRVLNSRDRRAAGRTAPAHGLSLEQVFYSAGGTT
ncbi:MAG TPA: tRNA pseudouridine(38-40) synthase TruA [Candidatus Saccharimonadaceae bacterium]|jgi:tRNA pseudouridine38-40 synthase|nr:tRNA pseudouridine(38-40) synthase TruA [Candidatus Saccharimonadaceae bacterium]